MFCLSVMESRSFDETKEVSAAEQPSAPLGAEAAATSGASADVRSAERPGDQQEEEPLYPNDDPSKLDLSATPHSTWDFRHSCESF